MGQRIPVTLGNIAPLAVKPFRPGKLALVCEGGGQRGIFTAGVLDEFMRAGFNPFDLMLGTSAGAQNLSAYMCNQQGYARKVITRYTTSRQFFDPMRFVRGGNLIDLDWLVEATSQQMPLAMNYAEAQFALGKELWLCACRGDDYSASYFSPTPQTWLDLIRASSAIPGFYRSGVLLDGVSYLDGGVSDAIPVARGGPPRAQTIDGDPYRSLRRCFIPRSGSSGWSAGWERVVCNRWSIWCIITKPPTAPSSSSSRNRRVSCGSSKSIRDAAAAQHGAWQPTTGAAGGLQNRAPVRPLFPGNGG